MTKTLTGILGPVTTPFDEQSGDLASGAFRANIKAHIASGLAGVLVAGSTGEAALLDDDERLRLTELARPLVPSRSLAAHRHRLRVDARVRAPHEGRGGARRGRGARRPSALLRCGDDRRCVVGALLARCGREPGAGDALQHPEVHASAARLEARARAGRASEHLRDQGQHGGSDAGPRVSRGAERPLHR